MSFSTLQEAGGNKFKGMGLFLIFEAADTKAILLKALAPERIAKVVTQAPVPGVPYIDLLRGPPVAVVANDIVGSIVVSEAARNS